MREKILKLLKRAPGYCSGESIAGKLKITRNAVHKHIKSLRAVGYAIESKRSAGYRLVDDLNVIDAGRLMRRLSGRPLGGDIVHLKSIGSTNDEAYKLAEGGAPGGTIVLSERQTKGKGRLGRSWESTSRLNLYFSIVLRPKIEPSAAPKLSVITALAVARAISKSTDVNPKIKWPNDILISGRKVCGILTEMKSEIDMIDFIIVGIGLNVNSTRADLSDELSGSATTLKDEAGGAVKREELLFNILSELGARLSVALTGVITKRERDEWARRSYLIKKRVTIEGMNEKYSGIARGIDEDGALLIERNGTTRRIHSGTVTGVG